MEQTIRRAGPWTWIGLFLALFGTSIIIAATSGWQKSDVLAASRSLMVIALAIAVMGIVTSGEKRPLRSIGLHFDHPLRSIGRGLVLMVGLVALIVAIVAVYGALGIKYGEGAAVAPSLWAAFLTVVRAGFTEEVLYRGFAFTRIEELSGNKWWAFAITLTIFAAAHYNQGWPGIVIAALSGAALTLYFMWKRDLLAVITAHFMVDFIPNVLLPAFGLVD
jgi:membrane protease YdiL (CAAX protease family)